MPKPRYTLPLWIPFAAALGLQAILSRLNLYAPDLLAVFMTLAALTRSTPAATVWGAASGLASDTLSGGLYGLQGFVSTLCAYLLSLLSRFIVTETLAVRGMLLAVAALARPLGYWGMESLFRSAAPPFTLGMLLLNVIITSVCGLGLMLGLRRLEWWMERKRYGRS